MGVFRLALARQLGQVAPMIGGIFRFLSRLLTFLAAVVVLTAVYIVYDGISDTGGPADCAVVLGAAVRADGEPSPVLRERLDTALKLYRAGKVPVIIVSGADPVKGEGYSESESMARYLSSHEVPKKAIILDHDGVNTDATARDLARIMDEHHFKTVTIVTSYYHITRTKMALKRERISSFFQAHAGTVRKEDFFNVGREVLDVYYHLFKYYAGPATDQLRTAGQKLGQQLHSEAEKIQVENHGAAK